MNKSTMKRYKYFDDYDQEYSFDSLTKVLTKQEITGFVEYLIKEKVSFTLAMIDIDGFNSINETYGYMIGEEVLQTFAQNLEETIGSYGLVGRYGVDVFMVVLPYVTEYNDVWSIFHGLNQKIPSVEYKRISELSTTITSGISRYPMDGKTYNEIVATADKALYRGKIKGRNCFIIYLEAKHSNILLKGDNNKAFSSMESINKVMSIMNSNSNLKVKIEGLVKFFTFGMMIDYVAIQGQNSVLHESYYKLCDVRTFGYVPNKDFEKEMNSFGLMFLNDRKTLVQIGNKTLYDDLKAIGARSVFAYKIQANDTFYGTFVAYSSQGKTWQAKEMDLFVIAANMIALELKNNKKTLEDIFK